MKKVRQINLRILLKAHAYLQTMIKTPVKFQKDWFKTLGGVTITRYLLHIHFHSTEAWKKSKLKMWKIWKKITSRFCKKSTCTMHHGKLNTMSPRFSSKRRGTIKNPEWYDALSSCHRQKIFRISNNPMKVQEKLLHEWKFFLSPKEQ